MITGSSYENISDICINIAPARDLCHGTVLSFGSNKVIVFSKLMRVIMTE